MEGFVSNYHSSKISMQAEDTNVCLLHLRLHLQPDESNHQIGFPFNARAMNWISQVIHIMKEARENVAESTYSANSGLVCISVLGI